MELQQLDVDSVDSPDADPFFMFPEDVYSYLIVREMKQTDKLHTQGCASTGGNGYFPVVVKVMRRLRTFVGFSAEKERR